MSFRRSINQKDKPREAHFLMPCLRAKEAPAPRGETRPPLVPISWIGAHQLDERLRNQSFAEDHDRTPRYLANTSSSCL